ncbi:helix-turn-helix domain-containing protein [Streptomyces sp. NPDC006475]|uniref:helix-turn-helix domain-containing protein n=1 Tax=Streptomyces sp. NPDC006475 TaxID=3155719 RepID=UPI0033A2B555
MPTLGALVDDRTELELRFLEGQVLLQAHAATKVTLLNVASEEDILECRLHLSQPPGALLLVHPTSGGQIDDALALAIERVLPALAKYRAAGLVLVVPDHSALALRPSLKAAAGRLRIPLLSTTAGAATWDSAHASIRDCRLQYAERQVERLTGLMGTLPAQWADATALASITDWLSDALEAQVLVSEPERGVLSAAPDIAAEQLTHPIGRDPGEIDSSNRAAVQSGIHTRVVSIAPTRQGEAVLTVSADRPFDEADNLLITHAAKVLGLVDQAQRDYATITQSAREARSISYQLLMNGETDKAQRVMQGLSVGLTDAAGARVYIIDCGSGGQRELSIRRCELAATGRAMVVRCPAEESHIVIVEPVQGPQRDSSQAGIAPDLQRLVLSLTGHHLGGSGHRLLTMIAAAREEALTALRLTKHVREPYALAEGDTNLVDLLDPKGARSWALRQLAPIRQELAPPQAEQLERTLSVAFNHPRTIAARILEVHRNTVATRLNRAGELLDRDLNRILNRVVVGLAIDVVACPDHAHGEAAAGRIELSDLLTSPPVRSWAETLLEPVIADRRKLSRTLTTWLETDQNVEKTATSLGLSEATIRNHLKTIEVLTSRRLNTLNGLRDLTVALAVCTPAPIRSALRLVAA